MNQHMATFTPHSTPLERETRANLPTNEAAYHLNRAQQTLRIWAMRENGPLRPIRVNGRLALRCASGSPAFSSSAAASRLPGVQSSFALLGSAGRLPLWSACYLIERRSWTG